jgi:DegV family protein with EDD domain
MDKKFIILPDVTCDLNSEIRKEFDIEIICGYVKYPNGKEEKSPLNWDECSYISEPTAEAFYSELKKNPNGFTTAPANVYEYFNTFEKYIQQGYGVLSMSVSSTMSGTYNFSSRARDMILEKYPEAQIVCFDSLRFGPGFGLMAIWASLLRKEGKTLDETVQFLEDNKKRFHQMGWLDDLSFVAKKGRISQPKAFFGTLIGVKPLGEFNPSGVTTVIGKAKGEKSAYRAIIEYIDQTIENPTEQIIIIANSGRKPQAEILKNMIEEKFSPKAIYINDVYPACGMNVGPGLMAAYYVGTPISDDLEREKELISKILFE